MSSDGFRARWAALSSTYSIYIVLVAMIVVSSLINDNFLSLNNFSNISRQISITTIIAFGQTMLIICGMIDLSSGSVMALAGVLSVASYKSMESLPLALAVGVAVGVVCNIVNALAVTKWRVPPFIATLSMMMMARGAVLQYTNGQNIYQIKEFIVFGQSTPYGIPTPVLFMLGITALTWYVLNHTRFGRYLYAIGGNEEAARASGIRIDRTKIIAYMVSGAFVGLSGVLLMSRVNAGLPNAGVGFEFDAMTATIIGGTSFSGGVGTAIGTLAGAFIMGFLSNILNLLGVGSYLQMIIKGGIISLAVAYDINAKKKRTRLLHGDLDEASAASKRAAIRR